VAWFAYFAVEKRTGQTFTTAFASTSMPEDAVSTMQIPRDPNFYQQFPSNTSQHSTEGMRKGSFEDVTFFIGTASRKEVAQDPSDGRP
jgi:hypothetical protein